MTINLVPWEGIRIFEFGYSVGASVFPFWYYEVILVFTFGHMHACAFEFLHLHLALPFRICFVLAIDDHGSLL